MRIAIIGYSGAGKSTLARALGERYACPVLHLDALHFLPGWKERGDGDALSLLLPRLQEKSWVIDGNYGSLAYWEKESNPRHAVLETAALPAELKK